MADMSGLREAHERVQRAEAELSAARTARTAVMAELHRQGASSPAMAKVVGLSESAVRWALRGAA